MTQPREPNGLVAFHISREKIEERKSIFLIPAARQPSHRGGRVTSLSWRTIFRARDFSRNL